MFLIGTLGINIMGRVGPKDMACKEGSKRRQKKKMEKEKNRKWGKSTIL